MKSKFLNLTSLNFSSESSSITCKELYVSSNQAKNLSILLNDSCIGICFKLVTKRGQRINFTTTEINCSGTINLEDCRFSGISALNEQDEISTLCHHGIYANEFFPDKTYDYVHHPSIFSSQSKLIIIYYTYIEYGSLTAVSSLGATSCEIKLINTCKSGELQVRKHREGHITVGNVVIKLVPGKCTIVQVKYNFDDKEEYSDKMHANTHGCETSMKLICSQRQEYHRSVSIMAYLRGLLDLL